MLDVWYRACVWNWTIFYWAPFWYQILCLHCLWNSFVIRSTVINVHFLHDVIGFCVNMVVFGGRDALHVSHVHHPSFSWRSPIVWYYNAEADFRAISPRVWKQKKIVVALCAVKQIESEFCQKLLLCLLEQNLDKQESFHRISAWFNGPLSKLGISCSALNEYSLWKRTNHTWFVIISWCRTYFLWSESAASRTQI